MGLIPVITGGKFNEIVSIILGSNNVLYQYIDTLGQGNPKDINELWYTIVGFQILSNLFINTIQPNFTALGTVGAANLKGCCFINCNCAGTQEDLQDL